MAIFTDKSINKYLDKKFVIYPFDEQKCLTPLGYDLRIGYAVVLSKKITNYQNEVEIVIPPQTSVFIITKEHIWLSGGVIGTIHAIGGLAAQGLFINSTTIDPNWAGQLTCLVTNTSDHSIKLDTDSKFITMILHEASQYTTNEPQAGPITVAKKYGDIYGHEFSQSLLAYLTSESNKSMAQIFKSKVETAQLQNNWHNYLLKKISNFFVSLPKTLRISFIAMLVMFTIFAILLIPYWTFMSAKFGLESTSLDGQTFAAIITLIATLILAIIGLFKTNK